ncbi:MAG: hypothetical protein OK438_01610 [Thaumarchaeota archaeon]|nr:hypothetical protein [Nitrososphaerota archaeon]
MSRILDALRVNVAYAFLAVGVVWLTVAYLSSWFVLWPVFTCLVAGILLRVRPTTRLTWAWATASAVLGLLLSGYAAYANVPLVGGPFSTIAELSLAGFGAFAVVHFLILYAAYSPKVPEA